MIRTAIRPFAAIAAGATLVAGLAPLSVARADTPTQWSYDISTTGNDVFYTSPTSINPAADLYDVTSTINLLEVRVRYLFLNFNVNVTDQIPPEQRVVTNSVVGPAPITLVNAPVVYPAAPEPPAISGDLFVGLNAGGFGVANFTNVTLGTTQVEVPGFGLQTVTITRVRVVGTIDAKARDILLGDTNCDGFVTVGDIAAFVLALTDTAEYTIQFPNCPILSADTNEDGFVTVGDIATFVALLTGL